MNKQAAPTFPELIEDAYPFQRLIGFEMVDWTPDRVEIHLPMRDDLMNRHGIVHGGVYALMLDTVMGFSGCFTGDAAHKRRAMTLSLTTNFLSRPTGTMLIATGAKIGGGARIFFAESQVSDETGQLIATGSGTFRYRADGG